MVKKWLVSIIIIYGLGYSLCIAQIFPESELVCLKWNRIKTRSPIDENSLQVDCSCVYKITDSSIWVMPKQNDTIHFSYLGFTQSIIPQPNPHFNESWEELENREIPTPLNRDQYSVLNRFFGLKYLGKELPRIKSFLIPKINPPDSSVIVLHFWKHRCLPCIAEIPALNNVKEYFEENESIKFISLSRDSAKGKSSELKYDYIKISEEQEKMWFIASYPTTVVLNRDGLVHTVYQGASLDDNQIIQDNLIRILSELLKE